MKFTVVIPARYASQRLPGKPLLKICGKSMIELVYRQAEKSDADHLVVATDHLEIKREVESFGGNVCMTRADHASGTDRLAEVTEILSLADDDIVVNVQGDEPLIPPAVINQVAVNLHSHSTASVATICERVTDIESYRNPNNVKVVRDRSNMALYFSRAPIPWYRDAQQPGNEDTAALQENLSDQSNVYSHIGIYAYKAALLRQFVQWPAAALEHIEKLEQLRVLENGHKIHIDLAEEPVPGGVDTEQDLERIRTLLN